MYGRAESPNGVSCPASPLLCAPAAPAAAAAEPPRRAASSTSWLLAAQPSPLIPSPLSCQAMGSDLAPGEAAKLFQQADADGSGAVDADELAELLAACHKEGEFHRWAPPSAAAYPFARAAAVCGTPGAAFPPPVRLQLLLLLGMPRQFLEVWKGARRAVGRPACPCSHPLKRGSAAACRLMRRCPVDGAQLLPGDDLANIMWVLRWGLGRRRVFVPSLCCMFWRGRKWVVVSKWWLGRGRGRWQRSPALTCRLRPCSYVTLALDEGTGDSLKVRQHRPPAAASALSQLLLLPPLLAGPSSRATGA